MNQPMKSVQISGRVSLPLCVGARALIYYGNSPIWTSTVEAIHQVAEDIVIFDTRNTKYFVNNNQPSQAVTKLRFSELVCA